MTDIASITLKIEEELALLTPKLKEIPIEGEQRFMAIHEHFKGRKFPFVDTSLLKDYKIEGAPLNVHDLNPNIKLKSIDRSFRHPLMSILRYIYLNTSSCYWPTAGILGYVEDDEFTILSLGSNHPISEPKDGHYELTVEGNPLSVDVEFIDIGLSKIPKGGCPRHKIPECTTGRCYEACRQICKQVTHTERDVLINAGLAEITNKDQFDTWTYLIKAHKYTGPGKLTLLFMGHWWWCEPCSRGMVDAGLDTAIFVNPEFYKNWHGDIDELREFLNEPNYARQI